MSTVSSSYLLPKLRSGKHNTYESLRPSVKQAQWCHRWILFSNLFIIKNWSWNKPFLGFSRGSECLCSECTSSWVTMTTLRAGYWYVFPGVQQWATEHWSVSLRGPVGLNAQPVGVHINLNEGTKWQAWDFRLPIKAYSHMFLTVTTVGLDQQLRCIQWLSSKHRELCGWLLNKQRCANTISHQSLTSRALICICIVVFGFSQHPHGVNQEWHLQSKTDCTKMSELLRTFINIQQWQHDNWYLWIQSFNKSICFVCVYVADYTQSALRGQVE